MVGYAAAGHGLGQCTAARTSRQARPPRTRFGSLESATPQSLHQGAAHWNHSGVNARGTTLTHILNSHVTAVFIDDDQANRMTKGLIGFQMHMGEPMKVEFRNVYLRRLNNSHHGFFE